MPPNNPEINKVIKTLKTFDYKLGDLTLSFTLNVDSKKELNGFYSMLQQAAEDVSKIEDTL